MNESNWLVWMFLGGFFAWSFYSTFINPKPPKLTEDEKIKIRCVKSREAFKKLEKEHPELSEDELWACNNIVFQWQIPSQREIYKEYANINPRVFRIAMSYVAVHDYREEVKEEERYYLDRYWEIKGFI